MRRRAALLCLCLVLAGCSSSTPAPETTTATDSPCSTTVEYEHRPVPDLPSNVTRETAIAFAERHAEALAWNDSVRSAEFGLSVTSDTSVVNRTPDGFVIHVTGGVTFRGCTDGSVWVADGGLAANYFVNETTAIRLDQPQNTTDDPREHGGEVVA
ncbi:hypothetical protein [Haloarchaeobius iranensis]|uniref:Uncharacterized protein n=1 Tax=Haloarchaeobius iranensis TaxID=996166 RepID=A0A1G9W2W7_9EURY|nr:hypothetical protein [Haloarchaeobius iranensis]SDM78536.1 hypothetical protein SAMN05192554_107115 [Haloarchaeobius iranensis]